jgi:glutaredoxin-like protein
MGSRASAGSRDMTERQTDPTAGERSVPVTAVEVFWRPGCPYCASLRRDLDRRGVPAAWRDIWRDEQARAFVRAVNAGNETVPTVRVGSEVLTNPSWRQLAPLLGAGPGSSAASAPPRRRGVRWFVSLLPVVALVLLSEAVAHGGYGAASWAVDAAAVAAWWFTRPLRR